MQQLSQRIRVAYEAINDAISIGMFADTLDDGRARMPGLFHRNKDGVECVQTPDLQYMCWITERQSMPIVPRRIQLQNTILCVEPGIFVWRGLMKNR